MTIARITRIRYLVIEASRNRELVGPVCWIGIRETRTSFEGW